MTRHHRLKSRLSAKNSVPLVHIFYFGDLVFKNHATFGGILNHCDAVNDVIDEQ